jgi:hypothetical protein
MSYERYVRETKRRTRVPEIDAFIAEIEAVCKKHGLGISHEDVHGAFVIEAYNEDSGWLEAAVDGRQLGRK